MPGFHRRNSLFWGKNIRLKALVWQDAAGQVWLGYNDLAYLAQRHAVPDCAATGNIAKAMAGIAEAAPAP